jgi:hypothetical protein
MPGTREYALLMVREALSHTALMVAMAEAAPAKYPELRAQVRHLPYHGASGQLGYAEDLAVEGVLSLGLAAVHNRAAQIDEDQPTRGVDTPAAWAVWGGFRRGSQLGDLAYRIIHGREGREWDDARPQGEPVMPHDPAARRYQLTPGTSATADELVSVVFGMWMTIEHPDRCAWTAPRITGGIDAWFRATAAQLWREIAEDADGREREARENKIRIEREHLAALLDDGRVEYPGGMNRPASRLVLPMHHDDRARLRFIEIHLASAFGFTPHDARPRRARLSVGGRVRSYL